MARRPGQARAENHVLSVVQELTVRNRQRLPSLEVLAEEAGVGRKTMWRAVRELVRQGVLIARRGSGVFVAQEGANTHRSPSESHARSNRFVPPWERVAYRLRKDIYELRYVRNAPLPSTSELAASYGVCAATMRKVLLALVDERLVEPVGRRFRPSSLPSPGAGNRVALVRRQFPWEGRGLLPVRQMEDLYLLENECERLGLKVSPILCAYKGSRVVVANDRDGVLSSRKGLSSVMGFFVWPMSFSDTFVDVWGRVVATGMPVALMCAATLPLPFLTTGTGRTTALVRTSDDFLAGAVVGRYLLSLGHTRAAFVDGSGGSRWAQARLAGLRSVFAEAGYRDSIVVHVSSRPAHRRPRPMQERPFVQEVVAGLDQVGAAAASEDAKQLAARLQGAVRMAAEQTLHRGDIENPALEACAHEDVDVWVADRDETALECQELLRQRRRGSRAISMIGFDNLAESLVRGLTSYDFGNGAAIRTALGFLLRPNSFSRRLRGMHRFQAEGFVVERGSVHGAGVGL